MEFFFLVFLDFVVGLLWLLCLFKYKIYCTFYLPEKLKVLNMINRIGFINMTPKIPLIQCDNKNN